MATMQIQDDPFIRTLLAKLPAEISSTFTGEQLQGLKQALDGPKRAHAVDLRWTLGFWRWSFYFAILFGRDRRELTRRQLRMERIALAMAFSLFVTISTLFGLLVLYLVKSAMGIDIFPNFSLGIWGGANRRF